MTGLLSVFSLLPVQPLKKEDGGDGEAEDDDDPGGSGTAKADERKRSSQDDEDSSDKEAERYLCIHAFSVSTHHCCVDRCSVCFYDSLLTECRTHIYLSSCSHVNSSSVFFFFMSLVVTLHLLMIFRNLLRKANMKLSQVLVEVLKTTAAAEETMGLHMQSLRDASGAAQLPHSTTQSANTEPLRLYNTGEQHQDSAVIQY